MSSKQPKNAKQVRKETIKYEYHCHSCDYETEEEINNLFEEIPNPRDLLEVKEAKKAAILTLARVINIRAPRGKPECITEGTKILLANGKEEPIEEIKAALPEGKEEPPTSEGLSEILSADGSTVYATYIRKLKESSFPTIRLRVTPRRSVSAPEESNQEIRYCYEGTLLHPVMRSQYSLTPAYLLKKHETVITRLGLGIIEKIEYCFEPRTVYTISLASMEFIKKMVETYNDASTTQSPNVAKPMQSRVREVLTNTSLKGLRPKEHVIYANGIAVGSSELQTQLIEFVQDGINVNTFA
jgi:hypothetical protein